MSQDASAIFQLRRRLALWNTGVFAVVLVGFALASFALVGHATQRALDEANQTSLEQLAGALRQGPDEFREEAHEERQAGTLRVAAVLAPDGRLLLNGLPETSAPGPGARREVLVLGGTRLQVARSSLPDGRVVVAAHDRTAADALERQVALELAGAVPCALALTALAAWFLAGKAARPVQEVLEGQRRFLTDASHELRTPLAVVLATVDVALQDPAPTLAAHHAALARVERTARRMARLVDDLLFLSRLGRPSPVQRRGFDLAELVGELVDEHRELAAASGVALVLEAPPELPIEAEPTQLARAIGNLLDNAIKFSPAGGRVEVALAPDAARGCNLLVRDQGPGVPLADQPHVFERFYRGEGAAASGSGLGLAIARAIAVAHGGRLGLASTPGQGTTMTLWLPTA
jgi:signal transduction histidine kinase